MGRSAGRGTNGDWVDLIGSCSLIDRVSHLIHHPCKTDGGGVSVTRSSGREGIHRLEFVDSSFPEDVMRELAAEVGVYFSLNLNSASTTVGSGLGGDGGTLTRPCTVSMKTSQTLWR